MGKFNRENFTFLHTYDASGQYWRGLEKAGLVRPGVGVRLVNSPLGSDKYRFNEIAQIDGDLFKILQERRCLFVVDRVAGGAPYLNYRFDSRLVETYRQMLGESFLGGHVHEAISNTHNDWTRLRKACSDVQIRPLDSKDSELLHSEFDWSDQHRWLEYGCVEDYIGRRFPDNIDELWEETIENAQKQARRFGEKRFVYCEGQLGTFGWSHFFRAGAQWCFAEVGPWASVDSQLMIAALRGSARAAKKPWGVYFAPWGPDGVTSFIALKDNSWRVAENELRGSGWAAGPENGPSSAMQRRVYFHAYLSGAHALYEEWGAEDNMLNWDSGELSSYGCVTRDLLDFKESNPDVGVPYTPLALVLDASVPPPVGHAILKEVGKSHNFFEPREDDCIWAKLATGLVDMGCDEARFSEVSCYSPSVCPEIFDIVPSDAPSEIWERYEKIIAVTPGPAPICAERPVQESLIEVVKNALEKLSPLQRRTDLPMQINYRQSDNTWIFGLYNPRGAKRGDVYDVGSILDASCTVQETIKPRFSFDAVRVLYSWPEESVVDVQDGNILATVGPGGTLIVEIQERAFV